jgi:hypothetical protein
MRFCSSTFILISNTSFAPIFTVENISVFFCAFWDKFALHLVKSLLNNFKTGVGTASSNGASWDECREQHQHQSNKKSSIFNDKFVLFWCN